MTRLAYPPWVYSHLPRRFEAPSVSSKVFKLEWHVLQFITSPAARAFLTASFITFLAAVRPPSSHAFLTFVCLNDFAVQGTIAGGSSVACAGEEKETPATAARVKKEHRKVEARGMVMGRLEGRA